MSDPGTPLPQQPPPAYEQVIVPPAPPSATAYPPAPSQVYAAPPPAKSNTVKIILIVVGVIVLLGVLVLGVVGYGAWKMMKTVQHAHDSIHMTAPDGTSITTGLGALGGSSRTPISATDLGAPVYPGATQGPGGMHMKTANGSLMTATYTTSDSVAQVTAFYKDKLGSGTNTMEVGGSTILVAGNRASKLSITIAPADSQTKIILMHTTHSSN